MPLLARTPPGRSPLGLLAAVALCAGLIALARRDAPAEGDCAGDGCGPPAAPAPGPGGGAHVPDPVSRARACPDAAYLCAGLAEREGPMRVLRWASDTREIRVLVTPPEDEDPAVAGRLQRAAARGIRAWDGHPFPIRIDLRERPGVAPDISVRWTRRLGTTELGIASTQWLRTGGRATMVVRDFALTTRSPFQGQRVLPERQVELTAAHEMGHALGLPHSDAPHDVMYPTNTASALSARDYRAMETLYALANGAVIE